MEVYKACMERFGTISKAAGKIYGVSVPRKPLTFSKVTRFWDKGHPTLRVRKADSDLCDLCTSTKNDLRKLDRNDERHASGTALLERHKDAAQQEREYYRKTMISCGNIRP